MLKLESIDFSVDQTPILRNVSLQLEAGKVMAVLGPNGAGKSSLLKVASGELKPSAGAVYFNDQSVQQIPAREKALHMSVLLQHSSLTFPFASQDVVALGRTPHETGQQLDAEIVELALRATDAWYLREQFYTNLSGGEKQRVQMARVLAQVWQQGDERMRLAILDEPTSALDYAHQKMVAQLLKQRAAEGCAILTALHDLNLAAECADVIVLMCCGEIRALGAPDDVLQESLLKEVFQVDFHRVTHPQTGRPWLLS